MTDAIPRPRTRLYLITPPQIADLDTFAAELEGALSAGDVACLQIRLKQADAVTLDEAATRAAAQVLTPIAQAYGTAVIINDSPALAVELGADGVHVGQSDMAVKKAREIIGPDMILGATAKDSRHAAMTAGEQGADYVAFGAFYETQTKTGTVKAELSLLEFWQSVMEIPCVAIGGITPENAQPLVVAGADFIATSAAIWRHSGGAGAAVRAFNDIFDTFSAQNEALS